MMFQYFLVIVEEGRADFVIKGKTNEKMEDGAM